MPKGEIYQAGAKVVILVGLGKLIDMAFGPSSEIIGLSKYYWFNLVCVTVLAAIVVIANYLFIPRLGIIGAAYGSVIALVAYNTLKFFFLYFKLKIQPFSINSLKVMLITLGVAVLNIVLPRQSDIFIDIIYRSFLITSVFATLIIASQCSEEVNKIYIQLVKRAGFKK